MSLTIIVYHYVRDLEQSRYPAIKGRRLSDFRDQLDYISRAFTVVNTDQIVAALKGIVGLPDNAAWLTFDDGYIDHYTNVFPLLHEHGWQGSFFPPADTVLYGELLGVNKIHFILAAQHDSSVIVAKLQQLLCDYHSYPGVKTFDEYWRELSGEPDHYDTPDVVFIKRLLQRELPEQIRAELTHSLFLSYVSSDPKAFAAELYMSEDQLRTLVRCGMYVGSHSAHHYWMDRLTPEKQESDIDRSLDFLSSLGAATTDWVMCYPYGASNAQLHGILKSRRCLAGLTTRPGVANIKTDDVMLLPRVDTNEISVR
jgi:peptidoglycan/xylan/chitin deacetylase (PgdA/CDA1 family)